MQQTPRKRKSASSHHLKTQNARSSDPFVALTRSIGALQKQLALLGFSQKFDTSEPDGSIASIDLTGFDRDPATTEPAEVRAIKETGPLVANSGLDPTTVWQLLSKYMPYYRRTEFLRVQMVFGEWWRQIEKQRRLRVNLVPHAQKILPPLDKTVIASLEVAMVSQTFERAYTLAKKIKSEIPRLKTLLGDRQGQDTNQQADHAERELVRAFLTVVPGQNYANACRQTWNLLHAWVGNRAPKAWESIQARHRDLIPAKNRKHRARTYRD